MQALKTALLFQESGEIDQYAAGLPGPDALWTSAERGAFFLQQSNILEQHHIDPQVGGLAILLVRHHGLMGGFIREKNPSRPWNG